MIKPRSEDPRKKASLLYSSEDTFSPAKQAKGALEVEILKLAKQHLNPNQ